MQEEGNAVGKQFLCTENAYLFKFTGEKDFKQRKTSVSNRITQWLQLISTLTLCANKVQVYDVILQKNYKSAAQCLNSAICLKSSVYDYFALTNLTVL